MSHRPGEICERCHKHIHPQTVASTESTHSLPACASCLPPGVILLTCGGCKLTHYFSPSPYDIDAREELVKKLIDQFIENAARLVSGWSNVLRHFITMRYNCSIFVAFISRIGRNNYITIVMHSHLETSMIWTLWCLHHKVIYVRSKLNFIIWLDLIIIGYICCIMLWVTATPYHIFPDLLYIRTLEEMSYSSSTYISIPRVGRIISEKIEFGDGREEIADHVSAIPPIIRHLNFFRWPFPACLLLPIRSSRYCRTQLSISTFIKL